MQYTTHSDYSLPDYEAFYIKDDHIKEKSNGSTTSHSGLSLLEYESFHFDLSIDLLPPAIDHFVEIPSGESKVHIEVLSVLWGNRLLDHGRLAYRCGSC
ncbi:hypothetical protein Tco_1117262 [Tanacetum coccineum]